MTTIKIKCPNCGVEFECKFDEVPISNCPICGKPLTTSNESPSNNDFQIIDGVLKTYTGKDVVVSIPDGVVEIGYKAFYDLPVTDIKLPSTLRVIGESAFEKTRLTRIDLNDGLKRIESSAFSDTKIKELTLPATMEFCARDAFGINEFHCYNGIDKLIILNKTEELNKENDYYFPPANEYVINGETFLCNDISGGQIGNDYKKVANTIKWLREGRCGNCGGEFEYKKPFFGDEQWTCKNCGLILKGTGNPSFFQDDFGYVSWETHVSNGWLHFKK